ncbi:alpha/beta hydrolase [Nonomuraea sp. B12E4]|uniref:alpha/beta hydrolase n=1 Tax=Nonomuraea sp. B12E4 TaxID=3153564 RepID=UPI00325F622F
MSDFLTRRTALHYAAVAGAGAAGAGLTGGGKPRRVTTFVLVSGSNGMPSTDPELVLRGHRVVGVSLPGHGPEQQFHRAYQAPQDLEELAALPSPMRGVRLEDYVAAAVDAVRRAAEHGPVILVGGSLGGAVITKAADEVPDLVDHLVYDTAFCCTELATPADYINTPEGQDSLTPGLFTGIVGDPAALGAVRINWRSADPEFLAAAKAAFMADASEGEFLAMLNMLFPDETLHLANGDARGDKRAWGRVPRSYIRHTRDRTIPLALQDRMIREADAATPGNKFEVFTVEAAHAPTAAAYARIREILHRLAK